MKVYRRLRSRMIWTAVRLLIVSALLCAVLSVVLSDIVPAVAISGGAFLLGTSAFLFFIGNVRLELEVGRLRYYKSGRLRGNYFLSTCRFRTHIECDYNKSGGVKGKPELELFVSDVSDFSGDEVRLDCTPIGLAQFQELIDGLRHYYESTAERERQRM